MTESTINATEGELLTVDFLSNDAGGISTFTLSPLPAGALFTDNGDNTAQLLWTPSLGLKTASHHTFTVTVTDSGANVETETVNVSVMPTSTAPYQPLASDPTKWVIPAEGYHRTVEPDDYRFVFRSDASHSSFLGDGYMHALPDDGSLVPLSPVEGIPALEYDFYSPVAGTVYMAHRSMNSEANLSSSRVWINGDFGGRESSSSLNDTALSWCGPGQVKSYPVVAGVNTLSFGMAWAGMSIDHLVISTDPALNPFADSAAADALPLSSIETPDSAIPGIIGMAF